MIIKSVNLNNIRSYLSESISFPLGSTLLSGDIGCGKSTILQAIEFALFGTRGAASQLLRHGQDSGSVELVFSLDGKDVEIKRLLKRGKSVSQESCLITIDGVRKDCMPTELKAQIIAMFGYPKDAMTRDSLIFRYTVYTPQEEMKHIMFDPDSRLATLRKIFGIDKYGQIRANVRILLSDFRTARRFLEDYTKDLDKWILEKSEKEKSMNLAVAGLEKADACLAASVAKISSVIEQLDAKRKEIEALYKLRAEASGKEAEIKSRQSRKSRVENELLAVGGKIKSLEQQISGLAGLKMPEDAAPLRERIDIMESERVLKSSEMAVLASDTAKMKKILESGKCAVCGQPVHNPDAYSAIIAEKVGAENSCKAAIESLEHGLKEAKRKLIESQESSLRWEKKLYTERSLSEAEADRAELQEESVRLGSEIDALNNEMALLSSGLEDAEGVESEYMEIDSVLKSEQSARILQEKEKSRMEQQLNDLKGGMISLESEIERKKAAKMKIHHIDELAHWVENQFIVLMDVMEKSVMGRINKEFMSLFQKWFDVLMQDDVLSVRLDEDFSPMIQQNGYETAYENLSGGEKTSVALAYRLALNKVINELVESIKTKDILILDEPTDGFSSEQLDRIRDVINELKLKQIIIVSHENKIDTFVDNVIRLHKDGHVSRVVK